ncbi:MAG: dipicolinate synthase subunit B [Ruminococcaceae bacterium]|nr:dipicolinate synthase subunit B [Oscillospiraceae bacterium]
MDLINKNIGFAMTGSFCTFKKVVAELENLKNTGANIVPIMSSVAYTTDTRFGTSTDFINQIENICQNKIIHTIKDAEPIGPKKLLDALIIAPCTGNTLGKLAGGITDTAPTMAAKAHLRNERPLIVAVSTNDGLGASGKNIMTLLNSKNVYMVPFGQDDPYKKTKSLVAHMDLICDTLIGALDGKQIQPVLF